MSAKVLFEYSKSLTRPETFSRQCRPRFSFFCIKLSKNRQSQNRRKLIPLNNPASQSLNHPNHPAPGLNLVCAPSQRCRVSKSHRSVCQPIFFKKFTTLSVVPLSTHQPNQSPVNAADITNSNIAVKLFMSTQRTHQPVACDAAALVVALYTSH